MSLDQVESASTRITERLIAEIDWRDIESLHTFVPIPKLKEVSTWPLLKYAWQNHPRILTAIPAARRGKYGSIRVSLATRWRGLLPSSSAVIPEDFKFDVIIVPSLAVDDRLHRLGWGGGWYDRFLAGQPQALKIGLAYQDSFVKEGLPTEPHDIALDKIITEKKVY